MKLKRTYKLLPDITLAVTSVRGRRVIEWPDQPSPPGLGVMDYRRREHIFYPSWSDYRRIHTSAYLRGVEPFSDDDPSGQLKDVVKQSRHDVIPVPPLYSAAPVAGLSMGFDKDTMIIKTGEVSVGEES